MFRPKFSSLGAPFFAHLNPLVLLSFTMCACGFCSALIGLCNNIWQIAILLAADGAASGVVDVIENITLTPFF